MGKTYFHASERTCLSLIYAKQELHIKSILYYLLTVNQFHF